jgi:hypothetical protein
LAPSFSSVVKIRFIQDVNGVTAAAFASSEEAQKGFRSAVAAVLEIDSSLIVIVGAKDSSGGTSSSLRTPRRLAGEKVRVDYSVTLTIGAATDPASITAALDSKLTASVNNGAFTTALRAQSVLSLQSASSDAVVLTSWAVEYLSSVPTTPPTLAPSARSNGGASKKSVLTAATSGRGLYYTAGGGACCC